MRKPPDSEAIPMGSYESENGLETDTLGLDYAGDYSDKTPIINGGKRKKYYQNGINDSGAFHTFGGEAALPGTSSTFLAAWNVANCLQGAGILSLPYAVKEGGYAAIITLIVLTLFSCYTCKILVNCLYEKEMQEDGSVIQVRVRSSYSAIGEACFKHGGKVIDCIQLVDLIAVAVLYLVLTANLLEDIFGDDENTNMTNVICTIITAIIVLPSIFLKTLNVIAWLSFLAVGAYFAMGLCVIGYSIKCSHSECLGGHHWGKTNYAKFTLSSFMVSFGLNLFHFDTVYAAIPSVEESMRNRSSFNVMIYVTFILLTIFNILYAVMAYQMFGEDLTEALITDSLPNNYVIVNCFVIVKALLTYPLVIFMIFYYIELLNIKYLPPCYGATPDKLPGVWAMIFRATMVIFTLFLAIIFQQFETLLGYTGAVMTPFVAYIFPCAFHMTLKRGEFRWYHYVLDVTIILVAVVGCIMAVVFATKEVVE